MKQFKADYNDKKFRKLFGKLPPQFQQAAFEAFETWEQDNFAEALRFKQIKGKGAEYRSIRVNYRYRVLGKVVNEDVIRWFWNGPRENLQSQLDNL